MEQIPELMELNWAKKEKANANFVPKRAIPRTGNTKKWPRINRF